MNSAELDLSPHDFDQTSNGWSKLDKKGLYLEAAQLIERYIESNAMRIEQQSEVSIQTLHFHAGQEYAMAGEAYYAQAIEHMERSYKSSEGWNLYVEGTLAFLSKDQATLSEASIKLSNLADSEQALLANALLLKNFSASLLFKKHDYAEVYGK